MEAETCEGLEPLQPLAEDNDFRAGDVPDDINMVNMEDVLASAKRIEMSHGSGEFSSFEQDIEEDSGDDDTEKKESGGLMSAMVSAYIRMCGEAEMPTRARDDGREAGIVEEIYEVQVVDMCETHNICVKLDPQDKGVAPALVLEGMMPCTSWSPTVAIKICVLEAYRVTHVRCPHLAIQSFVKSLCDIHGVAYRPYLCQQFSIAYDRYLDIRCRTDERVMKALGHDSSWRLKHPCPACTYKLEGENTMIFEMLTTMDGNDLLKRVLRREKATMAQQEAGEVERVRGQSGHRRRILHFMGKGGQMGEDQAG
ncbi:hypothetical protein K438DRAFT_2022158 [Mycena galopus ATCC 62051]|nr:hypothetical protein K438DRAFT_2022158 [Mycena galopus ATCC 62051]